VNSEEL